MYQELTRCVHTTHTFTPKATRQCDHFDYVRNINTTCIDLCQEGPKFGHVVYSSPLSASTQPTHPTDDNGEKIQCMHPGIGMIPKDKKGQRNLAALI